LKSGFKLNLGVQNPKALIYKNRTMADKNKKLSHLVANLQLFNPVFQLVVTGTLTFEIFGGSQDN